MPRFTTSRGQGKRYANCLSHFICYTYDRATDMLLTGLRSAVWDIRYTSDAWHKYSPFTCHGHISTVTQYTCLLSNLQDFVEAAWSIGQNVQYFARSSRSLVFEVSPQLDILCTSAVELYRDRNNNSLFIWAPVSALYLEFPPTSSDINPVYFVTALHEMQTRSSDDNSVCLSVRPSNAWIVTKRKKSQSRFYYHAIDNLV